MKKVNFAGRNMTLRTSFYAIFLALIIVGAFIKIPLGIVPVTLQFAMVLVTASICGGKGSFFILGTYILMGLIGIPIFAQGGGPAYIFNPTFGYLLGMLLAAYIVGTIKERSYKYSFIRSFAVNITGMAVVYSLGVIYMYLILNFYSGKTAPFGSLLVKGALVFIPTDLFWCAVTAAVEERLKYPLTRIKKILFLS